MHLGLRCVGVVGLCIGVGVDCGWLIWLMFSYVVALLRVELGVFLFGGGLVGVDFLNCII